MSEGGGLRVDKWLWHARFLKTRTAATELCSGGRMRVNGEIIAKAHHLVRPGDVLTFAVGERVRIIRIVQLAARRGPAVEARQLYEDLEAAAATNHPGNESNSPAAAWPSGCGRPTKAERRALDRLRGR